MRPNRACRRSGTGRPIGRSDRRCFPMRRQDLARIVGCVVSGEQDFVIGSRVRGEREPGSMGLHQAFAGRLAGLAIRLLYGVRYTDMGPLRAIRRDVLEALDMRERTYGWNLEMQMRVARAGLRVLELPVRHR